MDVNLTVGMLGTAASLLGAGISIYQSREANKAKKATEAAREATEAARDKFLQNIQYEDFTQFKKDCDKFCGVLQQATTGKGIEGRSDNYLENELEKFVTKLNNAISNSKDNIRTKLEGYYKNMQSRRAAVQSNDKSALIRVLDDVREISRFVSDVQMKNKLTV